MEFLDRIPTSAFETAGLIFGLGANFVIALQVYKEWKSKQVSSLSKGYVLGWWLIFAFWFVYGLRFDAIAITISNGLATLIQTVLIFIVFKKTRTEVL
jgi:uncharacterized protein with PQ loop repeat